MLKTTIALVAFSVGLLTASISFGSEIYGYVDFQKALNQCKAGEKAKKIIALRVESYQKELENKQNYLKKLKSSNDDKYSGELLEYQEYTKKIQAILHELDALFTRHILVALSETAKQILLDGSYRAIFQIDLSQEGTAEMIGGTYTVPFIREKAFNLTPTLIARLNENSLFLAALLENEPYVDDAAARRALYSKGPFEFRDMSGKKVGYVDLQKALNTSRAGKEAKEIIAEIVAAKQSEVEAKQTYLKEMNNSLERIPAPQRGAAKERYQIELEAYKSYTKKIQDELQEMDAKFTRFILDGQIEEVKAIFREAGYFSGIFEATEEDVLVGVKTVRFAKAEAIDLTDQLIDRFNRDPSHVADVKAFSETIGKTAAEPASQKEQPMRPAPATASAPLADTRAPAISIASPQVARGIGLAVRESSLLVTGSAEDLSGVALVTVNGQPASLDAQGNFSAEILLKIGENQITVAATDIHRNTATQLFTLVREADRTPVSQKAPVGQKPTGYHALIIGNNDYRYLAKLQTAVNDAQAIDRTLRESYGFKTKLLLNAGRKDILSAINNFRKQLGENDHLLIYYAGHGEFDRTAGKAYWLPVDAQKDDPSDWIIADDITASIRRLSSRHVLIVSDSCYSGSLTRSSQTQLLNRGERDEYLRKMAERPSRTLMASGGNEPVADGGGSGHSIFADSFLKALKEIEVASFSADELFYRHIKSRVAGRSDQVPEYNELRNSGHDGGDFVFIKNR